MRRNGRQHFLAEYRLFLGRRAGWSGLEQGAARQRETDPLSNVAASELGHEKTPEERVGPMQPIDLKLLPSHTISSD